MKSPGEIAAGHGPSDASSARQSARLDRFRRHPWRKFFVMHAILFVAVATLMLLLRIFAGSAGIYIQGKTLDLGSWIYVLAPLAVTLSVMHLQLCFVLVAWSFSRKNGTRWSRMLARVAGVLMVVTLVAPRVKLSDTTTFELAPYLWPATILVYLVLLQRWLRERRVIASH